MFEFLYNQVKKEVESPGLHKKSLKQKFVFEKTLQDLRPLMSNSQYLIEWDTWPEGMINKIRKHMRNQKNECFIITFLSL